MVAVVTVVTMFALNYVSSLNPTLHTAIKGF